MQFDWENLQRNTIRQLKAEADALSIFIPHRATKTDIIRILESQRSDLEQPLARPLLSKGNYIENLSPPDKVDIHQSAIESMKRNYLPSVPRDMLAEVIVKSESPYQKKFNFSPVPSSPTNIPISSPILKSPSISERFVPSMLVEDSTAPNSAFASANSSRLQSPLVGSYPKTSISNNNERVMTPIISNERSITPIHVPVPSYGSSFRVSKITNFFFHSFWILSLLTFIAAFSVGEAIFATTLFLMLFVLMYIIRSIEISRKAHRLATFSLNLGDFSQVQGIYHPDRSIYKKAASIMNRK